MPHIIISTATAAQVFIKRDPAATHAYIPGRELDRVTIAGGAGLEKEQRIYAETGKRVATADECDFSTTVVSDSQMEWLKDETGYQAMVEKGFLRSVHISEREAENMKPHHIASEVEHLLPVMAISDGGRQLTAEDFAGSLAKVAAR